MPQKKYLSIPLNGKLITAVDGIKLEQNDFQTLTNLRPSDDAPKGIRGMTKINASATDYKGIKTGYHFKKDQPSENHIIVQTNDISAPATASRLVKSDGTTSIPAQDTFSTFLELANNNLGFFSNAPAACVAFCNGDENYIWGGNESRCYGFIVIDPDEPDTIYDYTDVVNNTLTDTTNVATMNTIGGGVGTSTVGLFHFDNSAIDSSGCGHDLTLVAAPTYTTNETYLSFGTHAIYLTTSQFGRIGGSIDDWCFDGGIWTIDLRCYVASLAATVGLFSQCDDDNNGMFCFISTTGYLHFVIIDAGAVVVLMSSTSPVCKVGGKYHIEIGENGDDYYGFVDGTLVMTTSDANRPKIYTHATYANVIGACVAPLGFTGYANYYGTKYIDEVRLTNGSCLHTDNFIPASSAYSALSTCTVYLASTRPLQGCKMYIGTANTSTATVAGTYWNGSWTALSNVVDGTSSGGKSLAVTGSITWDDTQTDAKVKIINNQQYYWTKLTFSGIDATTTVYYCTLNAAIQPIKDIWDSSYRMVLSMMAYSTEYSDYTLNVYKNDYVASATETYVNISDMTSSQYIIVGFIERSMGLYLGLAEGYANTTASTVCIIYYWNGSTWTTVGALDDGTSQDGISLSRSGVISWDAPAESSEFTWTPNNGEPLYYYKITFNQTIDNSDSKIYLNYVAGIPAQTKIASYKFPLFWQNRLWLCGNQSGRKNEVRYSAMDTNCVFNGTDSLASFAVDGDDELMAGATLFTRFGGDIYDSAILCKRGQTFLLDNDPDNPSLFAVRTISTNKGCVAPYTMKLCDIGFDIAANIRKHILIWLSDSSLTVFDGVSIGSISDYFSNIFDTLDTEAINRSYIHLSYGEYDPTEHEYILCVPIGTTPTWKEIHYKLKQQSPFYVDRGTGKALHCTFPVEDSNGNKYMYGGTNDGFIERLEYGTTMDGNGIAYTFKTADNNLSGESLVFTRVTGIQLIGKIKSTTTATITATHYVDGVSTGVALKTDIDPDKTGYRIFRVFFSCDGMAGTDGLFHSTMFSITTNNENRGFEPILVTYEYEISGDARNKGG